MRPARDRRIRFLRNAPRRELKRFTNDRTTRTERGKQGKHIWSDCRKEFQKRGETENQLGGSRSRA
jgi:hypothetical protein